jgi:uncharacterized protein
MIEPSLIPALLCVGAIASVASPAHAATFIPNNPSLADVRITEFMYKNENSPGEFVQFTNLGTTAVNMNGWSEDDATDKVGTHSLSSLGIVQPGQSVILEEAAPATFAAAWNLASATKIVQENSSDNLGKTDTIFLYDQNGNIVDELAYGTTGPKTDGVAAVPDSFSVIGMNNSAGWELLTAGQDGAIHALGESTGDVGSPGFSSFAVAPVPLPAAAWLLMSGLGALAPALRRRKLAVEVVPA